MAKILEFPVKKQLTKDVEEIVYKAAEAYIKVLNYALTSMTDDHPSQEELNEIHNLIQIAYAKGVQKAIKNLENGL